MNMIKVISGGCKREGQIRFNKRRAGQVNSSVMSMSAKATPVAQPWRRSLSCRAESPSLQRSSAGRWAGDEQDAGKGIFSLCPLHSGKRLLCS